MPLKPRQYDPSGTTPIRLKWMQDMNRRWDALHRAIRKKVIEDDCFGRKAVVQNAAGDYGFPISQERIQGFLTWLEKEEAVGVLQRLVHLVGAKTGGGYENWTDIYVDSSYRKGVVDTYISAKEAFMKKLPSEEIRSALGQFRGPTDFLSTSMAMPVASRKLALLHQRVYTDLKGITTQMDTDISRALTSGMLDGKGPADIAREITRSIAPINPEKPELGKIRKRSLVIARTETIRAHAESTLDSMQTLGAIGARLKPEWLTAGETACPECKELAAEDYTIDEARGLIPAHPNCRCTWKWAVDTSEEDNEPAVKPEEDTLD